MKHYFNTVPIAIEDGCIEYILAFFASGWRSMRCATCSESVGIEVTHGCPTWSREGYMGCSSLDPVQTVRFVDLSRSSDHLPWCFLGEEEISLSNPKTDLVAKLPNKAVPKRLKSCQKE